MVDSIRSIGIYVKNAVQWNLFDKLNDYLMKDLKIELNKWFTSVVIYWTLIVIVFMCYFGIHLFALIKRETLRFSFIAWI